MKAPLPANETARLAALQKTGLLDSAPEQEFDDIVRLAGQICRAPTSAVTLVDTDRQWFKAKIGLPFDETEREVAFCAHNILDATVPLIVHDATLDSRFADNRLVVGEPFIRFYAGVPLVTRNGHALGSLCVIDTVPRTLESDQLEALQMLSRMVMRLVETRNQQALLERQEESLRQANNILRSQKAELRVLFDYIPAMIIYKDTDNRILRTNRRMAESVGRTVTELEGQAARDVFPESADKFYSQDQEVILNGEPKLGFIDSFLDRNGQEVWTQTDKVPVKDNDGRVTGLVVMAQDITARKRAEAALQQSRAELQVLFDLIPAMVFFKDTNNNHLRVNRRVAEALGRPVAAIEGRPCHEIYPKEADKFYADDLEIIRTGLPKMGMVESIQDDHGGEIWVQTDKVPYRDNTGRVVGIVVLSQDISDRKRIEAALKEQLALREQVTKIAATVPGMIYSFLLRPDGSSCLPYVSPSMEEFYSVGAEDLSKDAAPVFKVIHVDDLARIEQSIAESARTLSPWRDEFRVHHALKGLIWVEGQSRPEAQPDGSILWHGYMSDITERKLGEERLRLLGSALEQCHDCIVISDAQLRPPGPRIQYVNPAFTVMTGYSFEEAVGRTLDIQQGPLSNPDVLLRMVRSLARGKSSHGEVVGYRKDGTTFDLEWHVAPVRDKAGTITHFVGIQRDVTARNAAAADLVRAREEALESGRLKSRFLANMSHELRTPLNTINGLTATLLEQELPAHLTPPLGLILQCGESLLQNIQTILTHSSLESGKFSLESRPFALCEVALNALRITGEKARRKGITLDYHFDPRIPALVDGDAFRLQQVLVNFLANAIKFTDQGRVSLRVRALPGGDDCVSLRFTVADTGIGIPAEEVGKLFTPFAQAENSGARRKEGTGLGLAISKTLVDLMGGSVGVRSRPGVGSFFYFTVPFMLASVPRPLGTATAHASFAGRSILIEEARPLRRRMLLELSRAWRMTPTFVADAAAAAAISAEKHFDFAIRPANGNEPAESDPTVPVVWLCPTAAPVAARGRAVSISDLFSIKELSAALAALVSHATAVQPLPGGPVRKLGERIPLRILSADDIATNREMITYLCRHLGYRTDLVVDGIELVERVVSQPYDLLLIDVNMPRMDGLAAAKEICRLFPDPTLRPKLVALTANALAGDRERCLAAGMDEYLSKPLLPKALVACIERLFTEKPADVAPPLAPSAGPLVDRDHLLNLTEGMDPADAAGLIGEFRDSVVRDYHALRAPLAAACTARTWTDLEKIVHGFKGCFLSVGWNRLGVHCANSLTALREKRFTGWDTLPAELDLLFADSSQAMENYLSELETVSPAATT